MMQVKYSITAETLPEAEDLLAELDDLYTQVTELRQSVERAFNQSDTRRFLQGFVRPGKADLEIEWTGAEATVKLTQE